MKKLKNWWISMTISTKTRKNEFHFKLYSIFKFQFKLNLKSYSSFEFYSKTRTWLDSKFWVQNSHWLIQQLTSTFYTSDHQSVSGQTNLTLNLSELYMYINIFFFTFFEQFKLVRGARTTREWKHLNIILSTRNCLFMC